MNMEESAPRSRVLRGLRFSLGSAKAKAFQKKAVETASHPDAERFKPALKGRPNGAIQAW